MAPKKRRRIALAERRARVMELRVAGWPYWRIAEQFGVTAMQICYDVKHIMAQRERELGTNVEEYRRIQLERLDRALMKIWPKVAQGNLEAIDRLLRLLEHEAKLLGLHAPTRVDIRAKLAALAVAEGWDTEEVEATGAQVVHLLEARNGGGG